MLKICVRYWVCTNQLLQHLTPTSVDEMPPTPTPPPPPPKKKTLQNFLDTPLLPPNLCSWFLINWDTMPCIVCKDTLIIYNISCTSHVTKMCNDLATPKFNIFFILRAKLLQYHTWLASQENWRIIKSK